MLVVDDDPERGRHGPPAIWRASRTRSTTAADGEQALQAIARQPPGVILLDLLMPRMDGFELLKRLKADRTSTSISR